MLCRWWMWVCRLMIMFGLFIGRVIFCVEEEV